MKCYYLCTDLYSLTRQKDNGGLPYPSSDVVKILWIAEYIFKQYLGDAPLKSSLASKTLRMKMKNAAMREVLKNDIYYSLRCHDPFQDLHSTQISKAIVNECLNIRLLRYGQTFTEDKFLTSILESDRFIRK